MTSFFSTMGQLQNSLKGFLSHGCNLVIVSINYVNTVQYEEHLQS